MYHRDVTQLKSDAARLWHSFLRHTLAGRYGQLVETLTGVRLSQQECDEVRSQYTTVVQQGDMSTVDIDISYHFDLWFFHSLSATEIHRWKNACSNHDIDFEARQEALQQMRTEYPAP